LNLRKFEIVDFRTLENPDSEIQNLPSETLIWMEGKDRSALADRWKPVNPSLKVIDRAHLIEASSLAIWTTPPSPSELRSVIETVKPERIILFQGGKIDHGTEGFLKQLMGLVKFRLNHHDGIVPMIELACATTQMESTIQSGLKWMIYQGMILIKELNGVVQINKGASGKDPVKAITCLIEIGQLLEETAAYRNHFRQADQDTLFH